MANVLTDREVRIVFNGDYFQDIERLKMAIQPYMPLDIVYKEVSNDLDVFYSQQKIIWATSKMFPNLQELGKFGTITVHHNYYGGTFIMCDFERKWKDRDQICDCGVEATYGESHASVHSFWCTYRKFCKID